MITDNAGYLIIIKRGRRISGRLAQAKAMQGESTKFGVVTPKSVFRLAVTRNRVRRIYKEAFRVLIKKHNHLGLGLVFFPNKSAVTAKPAEIAEDAEDMISRVKNLVR